MKRRMLAVKPQSMNYLSIYEVDFANSFEDAKRKITSAKMNGIPYDELDLPVNDEDQFWQFAEWIREGHRECRISIFGAKNDKHFWKIVEKGRKKGLYFNT
jgi:hypothetical protein